MMEVTGVAGVLVAFKRIRRGRSHLRPTADRRLLVMRQMFKCASNCFLLFFISVCVCALYDFVIVAVVLQAIKR